MRIRYDGEQDILLIEVSDESIDHAEQVGPIIVHLTKGERPVLLEIMDATEFLEEVRGQIIEEEIARLRPLVPA